MPHTNQVRYVWLLEFSGKPVCAFKTRQGAMNSRPGYRWAEDPKRNTNRFAHTPLGRWYIRKMRIV